MRKVLTVIAIEKLQCSKGRIELYDADAPGLLVRATANGAKSFGWRGRVKGSTAVIRLNLGPVPASRAEIGAALKLAREEARQKARMAREGTDPRVVTRAAKLAAKQAARTFKDLAETYITEFRSRRRVKAGLEAEMLPGMASEIRRFLVAPWGDRPANSITEDDVAEVIRQIAADGKASLARVVLSHIKGLFNWACKPGRGAARLPSNPAERLKMSDFDLVAVVRDVVLDAEQTRAFWRAADALGYPVGSYFKMLLLSGQRRREVAGMKWSEIDLAEGIWTLPASRMKMKKPHEVPLSDAMRELLQTISHGKRGDYVFSNTDGHKALANFVQVKQQIDAKIAELSPDVKMPDWHIHDIRRSMRTGLSDLAGSDEVKERVLAHVPGGLAAVYDLHKYQSEKRQVLNSWAAKLNGIVNPTPTDDKVVALRAAQ